MASAKFSLNSQLKDIIEESLEEKAFSIKF